MTEVPPLADFLPFITATDGLKHIDRANRVVTGTRQENVAEHTWHTSLLALIFADAAPAGTDLDHVRDLLIAHDLVEIYAGDTVIWDDIPETDVAEREKAAAQRLFALLPATQQEKFAALAEEFAAQDTVEARFARALDALHPMLMSWGADGLGHPNETLTPSRVLARKRPLIEEFPDLWALAEYVVTTAVDRGLISPDPSRDR